MARGKEIMGENIAFQKLNLLIGLMRLKVKSKEEIITNKVKCHATGGGIFELFIFKSVKSSCGKSAAVSKTTNP